MTTRKRLIASVSLTGLLLLGLTAIPSGAAQFPIANTSGPEVAFSAAFDGANYLVGVAGDEFAGYDVGAQLVSPSGALVGPWISMERTGGMPSVGFGGGNYLVVWEDDDTYPDDDVYGRLVTPSGAYASDPIPICTAPGLQGEQEIRVAFGGGRFLVTWPDARDGTSNWDIYARLVNPDGTLYGTELPIAAQAENQRETAVAFDGNNFLVVWLSRRAGSTEQWEVFGRFVSPAGVMTTPFQISQTTSASRNPMGLGFDGVNYFVVWNRDLGAGYPNPEEWDLYGRLVSSSGSFSGPEFGVVTTSGNQIIPTMSYGGGYYLLCWNEGLGGSDSTVKAQFFTTSGAAAAPAFAPFVAQGNFLPLFAGSVYDGTRFLAAGTLGIMSGSGAFTDGDVYGTFLPPPGATDKPDLQVVSLTHSPASPTTASWMTFTAVVTNAGSGTAGACILTLQIGSILTTNRVPSLPPGAAYTVTQQRVMSVAQNYLNTAIVDADHQVDESDEDNNQQTDSYTVSPVPTLQRAIVFASDRSGNYDLWRMNVDGTDLRQLTTHPDDEYNCQVSPNGGMIAYHRVSATTTELRVMDVDGANDRLLTVSGNPAWAIAWLPDNSGVVCALPPECSGKAYRVLLDGTTTLFLDPADVGQGEIGSSIAFSPDGQQFGLSAQMGCWSPTMEIYVAHLTNGVINPATWVRLTTNSQSDAWQGFSPDGRQLVYMHVLGANGYSAPNEVLIRDSDGSGTPSRIAAALYDPNPTDWSPEGDILLTGRMSSADPNPRLWLVKPDGSGLTNLTSGEAHDWGAQWLPFTMAETVLLSENFEHGALHPYLTVQTVGSFGSPPDIVDLTNFGSAHAFGFGLSTCPADCFESFGTRLSITFPATVHVTRIEFKGMILYDNWGNAAHMYVDGMLTTNNFDSPNWNSRVPDSTYRSYSFAINQDLQTIDLRVSDITSAAELFIDDLVIYGYPTALQPTITLQPVSHSVSPNGPATLCVNASGLGVLTYQWFRNGVAIPSATGRCYTIPSAGPTDAGQYTVGVTTSLGPSVMSSPADLSLVGLSMVPVVKMYPGLTITGAVGNRYRVECITDLNTTNWTALTIITLPQATYTFIDEECVQPAKRFYRAVLQSP
jgi:hypothetical protein